MRNAAISLITIALLAAPACERGAPASGRPVVGVSLLTRTHTFFKDLEEGLRAEAAARNLDLIVTACEMDPARQAAQIEDFVAQGVAAILVAPCDSSAIAPHLAGPAAAGIPVFSADIAVHGAEVVSHVASDNVEGGRLAARTLAGLVEARGKVLVIDHPTVASAQDRVRGFLEEIAKYEGITVVGRPSSDGQRARAMAIMEDMLQAHPDLRGVFGINDDSALGATAVLDAASRRDVVVVGYDATPEARDAIRSGGPLKADVVQYPDRIGRTAIELVARHLAGEAVPRAVPIEVGLVTAETARTAVPASGAGRP